MTSYPPEGRPDIARGLDQISGALNTLVPESRSRAVAEIAMVFQALATRPDTRSVITEFRRIIDRFPEYLHEVVRTAFWRVLDLESLSRNGQFSSTEKTQEAAAAANEWFRSTHLSAGGVGESVSVQTTKSAPIPYHLLY